MEILTTFHLFSHLPPELRLRIWQLASPKPSSVISTRHKATRHEDWTYGALSIMHVCSESRFEYNASSSALESCHSYHHPRYEISRYAPTFREVFFSFKHDTLVMLVRDLRALRDMYFSRTNNTLEKEALESTSRVKYLALENNFFVDEDSCSDPMPFDVFPLCFKGLERVTFLTQDTVMDPMGGLCESDYSTRQRESITLQFAAASSRLPEWKVPMFGFRGYRQFQRSPLA